jgi:hypothetical protein
MNVPDFQLPTVSQKLHPMTPDRVRTKNVTTDHSPLFQMVSIHLLRKQAAF